MRIEKVKKLSVRERWLYWITERESIRLKKERNKPKPWTDDEILQSYRFCNARRMDDKVSKWLLKNWYTPYLDHSMILPAVAVARFINLPESLKRITTAVFRKKWNPDMIVRRLRYHRDQGNTVFNGAYMVRGNDGMDKIDCVVNHYVSHLFEDGRPLTIDPTSMQATHATIQDRYGFGSFMAGQIVADLRHAVTGSWEDRNHWAPIGPGSKKGMNIWLGRDKKTPMSQKQFDSGMYEARTLLKQELPKIYNRLEAIDVQNTFCEFSKYERTLWGEGRPKSTYKGSL